jgi:hypothetical protein
VDDNGEGYADDGREEDWQDDRRAGYYGSESEEDAPARGKAGKIYTSTHTIPRLTRV